jgi:hypothetical protein
MISPCHATRISPTGATGRAFAGSAAAATEAAISFPRRLRPADSDRCRSPGERPRSLCGDRWPQTDRRVTATGARHRRSGRLADDGSRGFGAEPLLPLVATGECFGGRLVVSRSPATLRLQPAGVGEPVRSQCELGLPSPGLGGGAAAKCATTSTQRRDLGAGGDEVSVAGGWFESRGVPTDGHRLHPLPVHDSAGRAVVRRLAQGIAPDPATHFRTTAAVVKDAEPGCATTPD